MEHSKLRTRREKKELDVVDIAETEAVQLGISELLGGMGMGPMIKKRLSECGYNTPNAIAVESPTVLAHKIGVREETVERWVKKLWKHLEFGFAPASSKAATPRLSTGIDSFDNLLGGGFETGIITELYGASRSGKTQICHELAVRVQLELDEGGLSGKAIYIDAGGSFRPSRLIDMGAKYGFTGDSVTKNVYVARPLSVEELERYISKAFQVAFMKNIRLLIIDPLLNWFTVEVHDAKEGSKGNRLEMKQKLTTLLHKIQREATRNNIVVVITNMIQSLEGGGTCPMGGHVLAHYSEMVCYLQVIKGKKRCCTLLSSSSLPTSKAYYEITQNGIEDWSGDV